MTMFENIQRTPDVVMIEEKRALPSGSAVFTLEDVCVETVREADRLTVFVTAQETPVRKVCLRWHFGERLKGQVLGDAFTSFPDGK